MILPNETEKAAIKTACRRLFNHERAVLVQLDPPVAAAVVLAAWDLKSFKAHIDARAANKSTAQAGAIVDRALWCSPLEEAAPTVDALTPTPDDPEPLRRVALERLDLLRTSWPVLDTKLEDKLGELAGALPDGQEHIAYQLTPRNLPTGMPATVAAELLAKAPKVGAGSLWAVSSDPPLVLRAPVADVYLAAMAAYGQARATHTGIIDSTLVLIRQLVAWSPEPVDVLLERLPGLADELHIPLIMMGGAGARASASFL